MDNVAFWLQKYPNMEETLCNPDRIREINQVTRRRLPNQVFDLSQYPSYVSALTIRGMILENQFSAEPRFVEGVAVTHEYYAGLHNAINFEALDGMIQVEYGFTLRRTNIRTFPTNDFITETPEDREFDRFQETVLDPAEPVIIFHHSSDEQWRFVQSMNYRGWVEDRLLAVSKDRSLWLKYIQSSDFLVVTGNHLILGEEPYLPEFSGLIFSMGAKLPLVQGQAIPALVGNRTPANCYVVLLPIRNSEGLLDFRPALVSKSADVHNGYLPFSRANLLRQVFKIQGDRYGWGGLFVSRDCSALVQDVFRSVGIFLARNAGEQAQGAGVQISFANKFHDERVAILRSLAPGSTLHFPGHVMFYLGEHDERFYVIHAIAACGNPARPNPDGTLMPLALNGIIVTSLSLLRASGKSLFDSLTEANSIP